MTRYDRDFRGYLYENLTAMGANWDASLDDPAIYPRNNNDPTNENNNMGFRVANPLKISRMARPAAVARSLTRVLMK